MQDAVGVDVEGDFDLRHAARGRRDAVELERAEVLVVAGQRALALQNHDFHARLVVAVGREDLRLARRDGGVARDHRGGHAARGLDGERERSHVEQEHVLHVALEHAALDGRADGDDFIRVHALVRLLADELARGLDDLAACGSCRRRARVRRSRFVGKLGVLETVLAPA